LEIGGKMKFLKRTMALIAALFWVCAVSPKASGLENDGLDGAIRELSDYLNRRIPKDSKVVFLNVKSDWSEFSEYILSSLIENAVNDEVFSVVDRQLLDAIRAELKFQWSGEVSDASAQEIGQMLGAQTIVSGAVTEVGNEYRIQVRALSVQTAAVQGLNSKNVSKKGPIVSALTTAVANAAAREAKNEENTRKKEAATDAFLRNSGFNYGGWLGLSGLENNTTKISGGVDIELRLYRYFGLMTGVQFFQDLDDQKLELPKETDKEEKKETLVIRTMLQIPVTARITLPIPVFDGLYIAGYGGRGVNVKISDGDTVKKPDPSPLSFIVGADLGMSFDNLQIYLGYQFNRDLSGSSYTYEYTDNRTNPSSPAKTINQADYIGQRSMLTIGIKYFVPFRRQ
jgi:hypothetical protein